MSNENAQNNDFWLEDILGDYNPAKPVDERSEFRKGATSALSNTVSGFKALAGDVTNNFDMQYSALNDMQRNSQNNGGKVGRIEDIDGLGSFTDWLSYNLGSGTASIGTMVAGGGIGGLALKGLAKGALVNAGKGIGATSMGFAPNYGESLNNAYDETGEIQNQAAFSAAIVKTALDSVVPMKVLKIGMGKESIDKLSEVAKQKLISDKGFTSWLKEASKTMTTEAITEGAQTYVDQVMNNVLTGDDTFGVRDFSEIANASAAGAAGSMGFGAYGGVQRNRQASALRQQSEQQNQAFDQELASTPYDPKANLAETFDKAVANGQSVDLFSEPEVDLNIPAAARKAGVTSGDASSMYQFGNDFMDNAPMRQGNANAQSNPLVPVGEAGEWQPNFTIQPNQTGLTVPNRGGLQQYTLPELEGEYQPFQQTPNSVPVGQVLESPVIEGEFNRPLGLPDNSNIIYGNDLSGNQDNLNYQTDGKPFGGKKAAAISKGFKQAQAQGLEPEVIKVNGGYGWRINNDRVDTGSIERQSVDESGSTGIAQLDNQWQAEQSGVSGNAEGNGRDSEQDISVGSGPQSNDNAVVQNKFEGLEIQEAPLNELTLSDDVPQFKDGANDEGVVTPLGGKFDRTGVAPIQVWVREDGRKEVVTGRHRLDLARRSNEETIPAQFHYEEDGFTAANAAQLDAILNIRDNQGQVKDYVNYFQATKITEEKAKSEGLLRQALGRRAYSIANRASEDVIASHSAGIISDEAAERLANVAPNEDKYQTLGLQKLQEGKGVSYTENFIRAVKSMEGDQGGSETMDMFGQDTSASIEADKMVKIASRKQRELRERLSAIKGAAKNPKLAKAEGVDIKDPNSLNKRIEQLTAQAREWDSFHTNPKLVAQIRNEIGVSPLETKAEAAPEVAPVETVVDENQNDMFGEPQQEIKNTTPAMDLAGDKINKEWVTFSDKTGTKKIPRSEMPQIKSEHRGAMVNFMNARGVSHIQEEVSADSLKPTQMEFSPAKVKKAISFEGKDRSILVSSDNHVLDGHHQWLAKREKGELVKVIRLNAPISKLVEMANEFPSSEQATEGVSPASVTASTDKEVEAKPALKQSTETVDKVVDKVEETKLANTDDVGGELSYNRRSWTGITSKDIDAATNDTEKLKMAQKEKVWKRPNYEEIVANGMDAHKAYFIKLVYDAIAAKPKYKSDKQLKIYVDAVGEIRDSIEGIVKSKEFSQLYLDAIQEVAQSTRNYMSMVAAGGKMKTIGDMILDKVLPKDDKGYRWGRSNPEGNEKAVLLGNFTSKIQFGSKQLRDSVEAVMGNGWPAKQEMWQKSYEIKERNNEFLVTKKGRGKILGTFNTKEAAEQFAKDDSKTERSVQFKEPKVSLNNVKRTGPDYREGKNVSTEEVMNEFGLRGINFGNWIKGDANAKERQLHINHIYDGLMDLSDLLNIPPKAIGLNGMLGVAVGAQGNGGKFAAHFVPGLNEINITRNSGAGSLAHEWGHALDHYFAVQAGLARVEDPFLSDYSGYSRSFPGDIRPEIVEAYRSLMKAMKSKEFIETPEEVEQGRKVYFERAERDLLKGIKAARNEIERTDKTYLAEFDKLANDVVNNPPGEYVAIGKTKDYADESVVKLYDLLVKARGRSADKNIFRYIESQKRSMNYAKSAEEYAKIHTPQTSVSTDFKKGAANLDGATKKPYWSTNLEMFARAFEMYVLDRLSDNGKRSDYMTAAWKRDNDRYLEHNKDAYPQDQEAVEINKAFDTLLGEIKTKEGENGNVIMFKRSDSLSDNSNPTTTRRARTVSLEEANKVIDRIIASWDGDNRTNDFVIVDTFDQLPATIKNAAKQQGAEGQIKGVFHNGKTYLVLDKNNSTQELEETIYHETYGHHGLRKLYGNELPKVLNKLFLANGGLSGLRATAKRHGIDLSAYEDGLKQAKFNQETVNRVLMDELLAHMQQSNKPSIKRFAMEAIGLIRAALRKMGFMELAKLNDADLFHILRKSRKAAKMDGKANKNSDVRFSRATPNNDQLQKAKEKLGLGDEEPVSIVDKIKQSIEGFNFKESRERAKEGIFDSLYGIKKAEEAAGIDQEKQGYISARLAAGVGDVIHGVMFHGAPEWREGIVQRKANSKGLLEVFGQLDEKQLNDFLGWMGGNRATKLMAEGRENNLTQDDIDQLLTLNSGNEELFNRVKNEYNAINSATLDLAHGAGLVSRDVIEKFDSEWYVPFFRQEETSDIGEVISGGFNPSGVANQSGNLRKLKGGKMATNDILENILKRQATLIEAAMKNKAMVEVADNLADTPYMEPVKLNKIEAEQVGRVRAMGKATPFVSVMRDGEKTWYKVSDPALLRGLVQLNVKRTDHPLMKMSRAAKRFLTTGVTLSPEFIIRNYIRDSVHGWMINKDGFKLGIDSVKGAVKTWNKDESTLDLMFAGASFQGGYVHATDPERAAQQIRRALRKKGLNEGEISKYLASIPSNMGKLLEKYRGFSDSMENANRASTYSAALAAKKSKKVAAFEAKDFMDFGLQGNYRTMQWLVDVIPFLNARLQGMYKLYRAGKAEGGDAVLKVFSKELAMKGMYVAGASLALGLINADDERYEELPDWDKDANWHFFFGEDHVRIPKPFELGIIFGTMPERLLMRGLGKQNNSDLGRSAAHAIVSTMSFNPLPQIIRPATESFMNYDTFGMRPIDSFGDLRKRPEDRYNRYTTETAKTLGKALGLSPNKIEHLIRGYAGTLGGYVLAASDMVANSAATISGNGEFKYNELDDIGLVRAFYKRGEVGSTYFTEQFYDMLSEVNSAHSQYKTAIESRDREAAEEILKDEKFKLQYRSFFNKAQAQMNKLNQQSNMIWKNETITLKEREALTDEISKKKNALAKRIILQYRAAAD